jgi:hypothetical protein
MAAIDPEVPENAGPERPPEPLAPPLAGAFAVVEVVDADEEPPHAATVTAATPRTERARALLAVTDRLTRRQALSLVESLVVILGSLIALPCVR